MSTLSEKAASPRRAGFKYREARLTAFRAEVRYAKVLALAEDIDTNAGPFVSY
jgi:hypothetical protein